MIIFTSVETNGNMKYSNMLSLLTILYRAMWLMKLKLNKFSMMLQWCHFLLGATHLMSKFEALSLCIGLRIFPLWCQSHQLHVCLEYCVFFKFVLIINVKSLDPMNLLVAEGRVVFILSCNFWVFACTQRKLWFLTKHNWYYCWWFNPGTYCGLYPNQWFGVKF